MESPRHRSPLFLILIVPLVIVFILSGTTRKKTKDKRGEKDGKGEQEISVVIVSEAAEAKKEEKEKSEPQSPEEPEDTASAADGAGGAGAFPPIWMNYRLHLGFRRYAEEMEKLGCIFLLYDPGKNRLYEIDRGRLRLLPSNGARLGSEFRDPPKRIENEPAIEKYQALSEEEDSEIYLALPVKLDQLIKGQVESGLRSCGVSIAEVTGIHGFYDVHEGRVALNIHKIALRRSRGTKEVELAITL